MGSLKGCELVLPAKIISVEYVSYRSSLLASMLGGVGNVVPSGVHTCYVNNYYRNTGSEA